MTKVSLTIPKNSRENTCIGVNKVAGLRLATLLAQKETSTQALSCGFWEMFKNTFLQNSSRWLLLNRPVLCYLLRGGSFPWTTLSLFSAIVFSINKKLPHTRQIWTETIKSDVKLMLIRSSLQGWLCKVKMVFIFARL